MSLLQEALMQGVEPRTKLTKEQYTTGNTGAGGAGGEGAAAAHVNTTVNHFHEKLLLLKAVLSQYHSCSTGI